MKNLPYLFILLLSLPLLSVTAQFTCEDRGIVDKQLVWIQSLLREQSISINDNDYLFYCTGHHGMIWSLIVSDSSGISLYNGSTRNHIEHSDYSLPDSLSFINANIKTIAWGFDSLLNSEKLLAPKINTTYNPIYNQLYVKNGNLTFTYNDCKDYYTGSDSIIFHKNLNRLVFLMFWLAAPSTRPYLTTPSDTQSLEH